MTVSALVSAYYAPQFIERRIKNLLEQEPRPEVVIVCQANSIEHKVAKKYPVKIVTTEDIPTVGAAWNLAIHNSTGELLVIANTDDTTYRGAYEYMEKIFQDEQVGLVFPRIDVLTGNVIRSWSRIPNKEGLVEDMVEIHRVRSIIGPMPMWRRSLHEQFGYMNEEYKVVTDYEFTLRLALGGVGFYYIARPMGLYLRRQDSLEHRDHDVLVGERLAVRPR